MHSSLRLSTAALTIYFLPFSYRMSPCNSSLQPPESGQQTQQVCFKRAYRSFVRGSMTFVAGKRNESRAEEHRSHKQQHGAPLWFIREAPVPMAGPSWLSQALPLYSPCLPRQHCCPPPVVSCGKTTLHVGFREKTHPFQDKNLPEREFTSVQVTSDYPKHITVSWLLPWHCDTYF